MERLKWNRKTVTDELRIFKERYDKDPNPIWLMQAFIAANENNLSIPKWVRDKLTQVFKHFLPEAKASLDVLMGCTKGKGQSPARADIAKRGRDVLLATAVDVLQRSDMKVIDAAEVAWSYCRFLSQLKPGDDRYDEHVESPPSIEEVRQIYYEWKPLLKPCFDDSGKRISGIVRYHDGFIEDILEQAPDEIRKKYPSLFQPRSEFVG